MMRYKRLCTKLCTLGTLIFAMAIGGLEPAFADGGNVRYPGLNQQNDLKKEISGMVKDELGPLVGVAIYIEGTNEGTLSDANGHFQMEVTLGTELTISYVGYEDQTITVGDDNYYEILLKASSELLDEIVVVGYGTAKRGDLIGAVDQVQAKAVEGRPVANLTQALQGTSPSLVIQQRSMNPNSNSMNINIRGISTLNNNDPLLVIDGMVADHVGSMNELNPNDIESVSILKDAGSAAIYGSRSANGVILITTKKGSFNMAPEITVNASTGIQMPDILLKPLKGYQNALLRNDSYVNAGLNPVYSPEEIARFAEGDSEWGLEAVMKNALQQSYNIGIRGGTENISYNVSFGYYDQESNYKGQDFGISRYNFRTNVVSEFGRFKLTSVVGYNRNENLSDRGGLWISDVMRVPTYNTYDIYPDEEGRYYNNEITSGGNFLASLKHGGNTKNDNDHFQGIVTGELQILEGLKAKAVLGYDLKSEHRLIKRRYYPVYDYQDRDKIVNEASSEEFHIEDYNAKTTMLNTQLLLEYNRTFNEVHKITGLFGQTSESIRRESNEIRRHYVDPDLYQDTDNTIYDPGSYNTPNGFSERALYSWLGRFGYTYMDKYYLEISGRYDGSSRFTKDQRWGFFPSASLGWRLSNEEFFSFWSDRFGDLRVRGSYGLLGSQSVSDYQYLTTYTIYNNQYGFNNQSVTGTGYTYGNELLTWENTATFDIGVDATFFNNKLSVSYDYFNKYTTDILLTPQTPSTLGGAVPKANIGEMRNLGWELTVNYRLYHGEFSHFFGFNLGDSFNKVMKYGDQDIARSDEIERIIREGVPLYSYYGYKTDGLFQTLEEISNSALPLGASVQPGDVKYVDRNKDGVIDDNDRYILGNAFPRYTFGFSYNMNWRGIDVDMLWQGVGKRDMALRGEMIEPFHGSYYYVMFEHQLDYWSPGNTDANYPRLVNSASPSYSNNYSHSSDRNIYDAAYLRLKNIQIGYSLPQNITSKMGIEQIRIYASGQNLLTLTKNRFIDPESSEFGNSMNAGGANSGRNYPTLKYYGGGIEVKF
ncbi:SusC/RagA family TonB-linked outer membrane protein [Thermophagus sp. OGC60D27]|uniref:SusC/RagA family TonB-linked outer membrane protein n=1 Tax=Thermophagus sp. OGC60D27 TaxID=3458415 RepID=UPI004037B288